MPVRSLTQSVTQVRANLHGITPTPARPVKLVARDMETAQVLAAHRHAWGQITYAREGMIRVTVGNSTWIVPPLRAIWVPPHTAHEILVLEQARLRALYVHADAAPFPGPECVVLEVSPLLRELILALAQVEGGSAREAALTAAILSELAHAATLPIRVALPVDKRLKALCETLIADPASPLTLGEWARQAGASERTLARLFAQELGMTFGQWRQQIRLAHAAPLIARTAAVSGGRGTGLCEPVGVFGDVQENLRPAAVGVFCEQGKRAALSLRQPPRDP
jgi:AraC-like DNA-binding protein/quercetin dioxygenase-like cupin family protein